jgi:hypothetical protein
MEKLRKVRDAAEANRTSGGRPTNLYCSEGFARKLFEEVQNNLRAVVDPSGVPPMWSVYGLEVRRLTWLPDDTIIVSGLVKDFYVDTVA